MFIDSIEIRKHRGREHRLEVVGDDVPDVDGDHCWWLETYEVDVSKDVQPVSVHDDRFRFSDDGVLPIRPVRYGSKWEDDEGRARRYLYFDLAYDEMDAEDLDGSEELEDIVRAGAGYDLVDLLRKRLVDQTPHAG